MEGNTMSTLLTELGTFSTQAITQVGAICNTIMENPLLLFTTGFLFLGGCIGITGRLMSRG